MSDYQPDYRPKVAIYFDELEAKYGPQFMFGELTDEELLKLERLGHLAIKKDSQVTEQEKKLLEPLMTLIEKQKMKRNL